MKHKLFKPFMRLTKKAEGKGMGLYLVKNMIERNGGRIEVESTINNGTTFTCYLKKYTQTDTHR
jgi:signal transduction histidine kinase